MAVTVYFVRHGQTYFNLYSRMQGWSDAPLTEKGINDGKQAGIRLKNIKFDYIFSSDLKRAVDTAKLLLANHPQTKFTTPVQDPDFREIFFGVFEGLNGDEVANTVGGPHGNFRTYSDMVNNLGADKVKDLVHEADPYHHAEDAKMFWERMDRGLNRLRSLPDGSVAVVVSHGAAIRSIASRFADNSVPVNESAKNGAVTKLTLSKDATKVNFYNQVKIPDD